MLVITPTLSIKLSEIKLTFVAAPGPGGQNVNKVATSAQLRFDVLHSPSLPDDVRLRLITLLGSKLTSTGELIIKASRHRTQDRNRQDALERLCAWIKSAAIPPKKRKKTRPTLGSKKRRLVTKKITGEKKSLRKGVKDF